METVDKLCPNFVYELFWTLMLNVKYIDPRMSIRKTFVLYWNDFSRRRSTRVYVASLLTYSHLPYFYSISLQLFQCLWIVLLRPFFQPLPKHSIILTAINKTCIINTVHIATISNGYFRYRHMRAFYIDDSSRWCIH